MRNNLIDIFKVLKDDEILLRLLYYLPSNSLGSPLDVDAQQPNIIGSGNHVSIIKDRIKLTPKVDDLVDDTPKNRLMMYAGIRGNTNNYLLASQEIIFDIFTHFEFEENDIRSSWIADRTNELITNKNITGIGKVYFEKGTPISAPNNYIGYRMVYNIGSKTD